MRFTKRITADREGSLLTLLSSRVDLSNSVLKDCMIKGAVWLKKGNSKKENRVRRAKTHLIPGDKVSLYYDSALLSLQPPGLSPLFCDKNYSVWNKPPGLLSQGTRWGDHYSLLRVAEKHLKGNQQAYLVHRLDREARGLVLIGHHKKSGALFSRLFQERQIEKQYEAEVEGIIEEPLEAEIALDIDGKSALTRYRVIHRDKEKSRSTLAVKIETGRKHQIRRHLSAIGHPIVGDSIYGTPDNAAGLLLVATALCFTCPFTGLKKRFEIGEDEKLGRIT